MSSFFCLFTVLRFEPRTTWECAYLDTGTMEGSHLPSSSWAHLWEEWASFVFQASNC